jgi:hypothetical protein
MRIIAICFPKALILAWGTCRPQREFLYLKSHMNRLFFVLLLNIKFILQLTDDQNKPEPLCAGGTPTQQLGRRFCAYVVYVLINWLFVFGGGFVLY